MLTCLNAHCKFLYNSSSQVNKGSLKPAMVQGRPTHTPLCQLLCFLVGLPANLGWEAGGRARLELDKPMQRRLQGREAEGRLQVWQGCSGGR